MGGLLLGRRQTTLPQRSCDPAPSRQPSRAGPPLPYATSGGSVNCTRKTAVSVQRGSPFFLVGFVHDSLSFRPCAPSACRTEQASLGDVYQGAPYDAKAAGGCGQPPPSDEGLYVSVLPVPQTRGSRHAAMCQPVQTAHTTACGGQESGVHPAPWMPRHSHAHRTPGDIRSPQYATSLEGEVWAPDSVETGLLRSVITLEALLPPFIRHFAAWGTGLLVEALSPAHWVRQACLDWAALIPGIPIPIMHMTVCNKVRIALSRVDVPTLGGRGVYPLGSCSMLSAHCAQTSRPPSSQSFLPFPRPGHVPEADHASMRSGRLRELPMVTQAPPYQLRVQRAGPQPCPALWPRHRRIRGSATHGVQVRRSRSPGLCRG